MAYTNFTCGNCGRFGMEISADYSGPLVLISKVGDAVSEYVNNHVLIQWRAKEEEARKYYREHEQRWLTPLPPRMPYEIDIAYRADGHDEEGKVLWQPVTHGECYDITTPPDPIRVRHDEHWNGIWKELRAAGIIPDGVEIQEAKNGYYDDKGKEPWYTFVIHGATFTVGPRKRVVAIRVSREEPFTVSSIAELARQANTSYWTDESWQDWTTPTARGIEVHAWKREDVVLYLTTIINDLSGDQHVGAETRSKEAGREEAQP